MLNTAVAIIFALFATGLAAMASVMQRRATGQAEAEELFKLGIVRRVLRNKLWLTGVGLQVIAFFAQAMALYHGSLVLVAPLLTTDLIFLMLILHYWTDLKIGRREWTAVFILVVGLVALLVTANPSGGSAPHSFSVWAIAMGVIGAAVIAGAISMRRARSIRIRAFLGGATAGAHFSLTAALTKLVVVQLGIHGAAFMFTSWEIYALAVVGISSALTVQSMYGSGSLAISQPSLEITEVLAGLMFGIYMFGDHIRHSALAIAIEVISGLLLAAGIIMLASSRRFIRAETSI